MNQHIHQARQLNAIIPAENRVPRCSVEDFFATHYDQSPKIPCVIEGLFAAPSWNRESLRSRLGEVIHTFRYEERATLQMKLGDYIDAMYPVSPDQALPRPPSSTEVIPYARHVGPLAGDLHGQVDIEQLFPASVIPSMHIRKFLFFGAPETKTNCHYDWSHNFSYVVEGIKHVTLLPPSSEFMMNLSQDERKKMAAGSCYFFEDPAVGEVLLESYPERFVEHPVFTRCPELYVSALAPGDAVFFPAYWYHYFHNISATISVTIQTELS